MMDVDQEMQECLEKSTLTYIQGIERLQAAIDNKPYNPPIPRLSLAQRDDLRKLVNDGRIDEALGDLSYFSQVAFGRMEKNLMHEFAKRKLENMQIRLLQLQCSKLDTAAIAKTNEQNRNQSTADKAVPKKISVDQQRSNTLIAWYEALRQKHSDSDELIRSEINTLTIKEIIEQLKIIETGDARQLWFSNQAERFIKDNGFEIWGFKKEHGRKKKQFN
jgi:hypothetical protein